MSKYLQYYGNRLQKEDNQYGGFFDTAAELFNPMTAIDSYRKKGVVKVLSEGLQEAKDYSDVRDNISNRPKVLRKIARGIRNTRFDQSQEKKLINYKDAQWANLLSMSPTSEASALAIVGGMFYIAGNAYESNDLLNKGDEYIEKSRQADSSNDQTLALNTLAKGTDALNEELVNLGANPAWYNIPGQVKQLFDNNSIGPALMKYSEALHSNEEKEFAQAMRAARGEDRSPATAAAGILGMVVGGAVLIFTAPMWIGAATSLATSTAKGVGNLASKGAKSAAKGVSSLANKGASTVKDSVSEKIADKMSGKSELQAQNQRLKLELQNKRLQEELAAK